MTPASTTTELPQPHTAQNRLSRWTQQRRLRRDLAHRDRAAAQLAELHQIRTFIATRVSKDAGPSDRSLTSTSNG